MKSPKPSRLLTRLVGAVTAVRVNWGDNPIPSSQQSDRICFQQSRIAYVLSSRIIRLFKPWDVRCTKNQVIVCLYPLPWRSKGFAAHDGSFLFATRL